MYACVASCMIQAWRLFGLRFLRWPPTLLAAPLGALICPNLFTHHALPDLRYVLVAAVLLVFGRMWVAFTPVSTARGRARRKTSRRTGAGRSDDVAPIR